MLQEPLLTVRPQTEIVQGEETWGLGFPFPMSICPVCGVSTALDTCCSSRGCCGHTGLVPAIKHLSKVGLGPGCARELVALVAT